MKTSTMKQRTVGEWVTWTSQAGGYTTRKRGVVHEVVPAGSMPQAKIRQPGQARDHESYVVNVDGKPYWPLAKNLQTAKAPALKSNPV